MRLIVSAAAASALSSDGDACCNPNGPKSGDDAGALGDRSFVAPYAAVPTSAAPAAVAAITAPVDAAAPAAPMPTAAPIAVRNAMPWLL